MPPTPASCTVSRLGLVEYGEVLELQRRLVAECRAEHQARLLLLEHPPTYTLGARGKATNLLIGDEMLNRIGASVHRIDRGGDVTFHGPGQLVAYPILDLTRWGKGPLWYVRSLERVLIETLKTFGLDAERWPGRPGVYVRNKKIASIGVHVSRGITSHGFALNVDPDLSYFSHIVPCGLPDVTMTSMAQLLPQREDDMPSRGIRSVASLRMTSVIDAVVRSFGEVFELDMEDGERVAARVGRTAVIAR
jgi:lipoate-protein ligase B